MKEKKDRDDEWLIIKIPKKGKECFLVDYCDGDDEDEFQWLEGPYLQDDLTIKDLLDRRRCESRTKRRRRGGKSELRNDTELDQRDNEGKLSYSHYSVSTTQE